MKVVQLNSVCGAGSTGRIAVGISEALNRAGIENHILYTAGSSDYPQAIRYGNRAYIKLQALLSRFTGHYGFLSAHQTKRLIRELERIAPDVVHIHNIHGHDCNLETLLTYLKSKRIKTVFTLHDCWLFTGYCTYFTAVGCEKWKTDCFDCPQCKRFSLFRDKSMALHRKKKAAFEGLDAVVVTPSRWLADLAEQSFLKQFPIRVIHNGIDLSVFKPTPSAEKQDVFTLLGVSTEWGYRKGLDTFVRLAEELGDAYQIVLVGTNKKLDRALPKTIRSIHRTDSAQQLAQLYTAADLFVNPTREENFPTVNLESLACGTPVLTYRTGGSPESLTEQVGAVVNCDDYGALKAAIARIRDTRPFASEDCVAQARRFDKGDKFDEYVELYKRLFEGDTI